MSKESIWNGLDRYDFSDKAKASIMGNMWEECQFRSNNVEDRYHNTGGTDEGYTLAVDNGTYDRNDFMYDHGQAYGYGLCQWTYWTRKAGLYDLAKGRGVSIADEAMQLDYMWKELQTTEFSGVLAVLRDDNASLREMTEKFMVDFEKPANKSQAAKDYRVSLAEQIYNEFAGRGTVEDKPETPFWPPRGAKGGKDDPGLCQGMTGADVQLLQSLLLCHGYNPGGCSGIYDTRTHNMVIAFQAEKGLTQDGIAGPKTFKALGVVA